MSYTDTVTDHWYSGDGQTLIKAIEQGLVRAGKDPANLSSGDLKTVDEFHIRGLAGTRELAAHAGFQPGERVADIGSGIGGPSRYLAENYDVSVEGIDLTPAYVETATHLANLCGLADRVHYSTANALQIPFEDASFDVAWSQHISMNIADKGAFFAELTRIVKAEGRVAIYDPIAGNGEPLTLPVPWARDPAMSHLIDLDSTVAHLEEAGLNLLVTQTVTQQAIAWFEKQAAAPASAEPPPLSLELLMGSDWPEMAGNMAANLRAGRLDVVHLVAQKP
jgi:ubiquinone/menaquinone biosynthesis C-methylase UbiE